MTPARSRLLAALLALLAALPLASAQPRADYTQAELEQMLAPIALYPDPLLSQILMASTYPLEVIEAARWSRRNPGLQGDDAVRAVQDREWDPSVQSLVAFPQVLARMEENIEWTRKLGEAFLGQQPLVMDTIQELRRKARAAGQLAPDERYRVIEDGRAIVIAPADPQVLYVPYYDPWTAYGPWWWPAYPPVVWAPWPGYAVAYRPGVTVSYWWGAPIGISAGFFFGGVDWHRRHVRVERPYVHYYHRHYQARGLAPKAPGRWQHDPSQVVRPVRREPAPGLRAAAPAPAAHPRFAAPPPATPQPRAPRVQERPRDPARFAAPVQSPRPEPRAAAQPRGGVQPQPHPQPRMPEARPPRQHERGAERPRPQRRNDRS